MGGRQTERSTMILLSCQQGSTHCDSMVIYGVLCWEEEEEEEEEVTPLFCSIMSSPNDCSTTTGNNSTIYITKIIIQQ